jgi:uncharacterized protein
MLNYKKKIIQILTIIIILYFSILILFTIFQKDLVYYPDNQDFNNCKAFEDSEKITYNGTRFYYKEKSDQLIVIYHGNARSACSRGYIKEIIDQYDLSYIFVEYTGYSNDKNKPSKKAIISDIKNVNTFITELNPTKTIYLGESIGTGVVSYHASINEPNTLILVSPFDSILSVAKKKFWMFPVKLVFKENFDNINSLKNFNNKLIIFHGIDDKTVPISHSKELFDTLQIESKQYVKIDNAGHNDVFNTEEFNVKFKKLIEEI